MGSGSSRQRPPSQIGSWVGPDRQLGGRGARPGGIFLGEKQLVQRPAHPCGAAKGVFSPAASL